MLTQLFPSHFGEWKSRPRAVPQVFSSILKWYYHQKPPYLFFLHFESMIYNYLPRQILVHDFNEKSEFLDIELSINCLPFLNSKMAELKRELGRGRMWRHPIKTSIKQTK